MIGQRIRELRVSKELTLKQLGVMLNLGESTMSMYENNKRSPDYDTVLKLAEIFEVSTDFILGRTATKEPYSVDQSKIPTPVDSFSEIEDLSEESKKELEKYIHLLKMKDQMDKSKEEQSCASEKKA